MLPLPPLSELEPGDVLTAPGLGLVVLTALTPQSLSVEGAAGPRSVPTSALAGWMWAIPHGVLYTQARVPTRVRDLLLAQPDTLFLTLLDELGGEIPVTAFATVLADAGLVPAGRAPGWVAERLPALPGHVPDAELLRHPSAGHAPNLDAPSATARARAFFALPRPARAEALESAIRGRRKPALPLLLRGGPPLPPALEAELGQLLDLQDPLAFAVLLQRLNPEALARALSLARGARADHLALRRIVDIVPSVWRPRVLLHLLDHALAAADGEPAALFLSGQLSAVDDRALLDAVPRAAAYLAERSAEVTLDASARRAADRPIAAAGPLAAERLFPLATALARALAARHAMGAAGGVGAARVFPDGRVELGPPEASTPRDDVGAGAKVLLELAVGRVPRRGSTPEDLLSALPRLVPEAPPEWCAVLTRAASAEPAQRPRNGLDWWEQLATAAAIAGVRADAPLRPQARWSIGHDTHIGHVKSRIGQTNQDAVFFHQDGELALLVVADGISVATAGSGDLASAILVQTLAARWSAAAPALRDGDDAALRAFLVDALAAANNEICAATLEIVEGELGGHAPMGTTVLAAVCRGDRVWLASLGDSRAWLVGAHGAASLTAEQNVRGEWLRAWQQGGSPELDHDGYALVGYCGHFDETGRPAAVPPLLRAFRVLPGEQLVLASDGLSDYAAKDPAVLAALIEDAVHAEDPTAAARRLVDAANRGGGGDNITVLVARQSAG